MTARITNLIDIGASPGDDQDRILEKRMLVTVAGLGVIVGVVWGAVYLALGEPLAALIPGIYGMLTVVNLVLLAATKRYRLFQTSQLLFYLFLPFALQLTLGGFVGASAVVVFALFAPFGALVMRGRQSAARWMLAYVALLVTSLILEPAMTINNTLSPQVVGWLFVGNIAGISLFMFVTMHYFVGQRDRTRAALEVEQEKSERLLLNILPEEVARDLKETGTTEANFYGSATVLFADQVGFTRFTAERNAEEVVGFLNDVFTAFDGIAASYGVEKIRTIGDAFMAVAGVPVESDDHAPSMASAALEMLEFLDEYDSIEFRIGIHSGPLVAGVVGTSKFQYDIWGDTVNTASRLTSSSEPGRIQISGDTHALLGDDYVYEPRGQVEVKGKEPMTTWFLLDERSGGVSPSSRSPRT